MLWQQTKGVMVNQFHYVKRQRLSLFLILISTAITAIFPLLGQFKYTDVSARRVLYENSDSSSSYYYLKVQTDDPTLTKVAIGKGIENVYPINSSSDDQYYDNMVTFYRQQSSSSSSSFLVEYRSGYNARNQEIKEGGVSDYFGPYLLSALSLLARNGTIKYSYDSSMTIYSFASSYEDVISSILGTYIGIFVTIAAGSIQGIFVNFLQEDHEKKLKEGFYLAGLKPMAYWTGNIGTMGLIALVTSTISTVLFSVFFKLPIPRASFMIFSIWIYTIDGCLLASLVFRLLPDRKTLRNVITSLWYTGLPILFAITFFGFKSLYTGSLMTVLVLFFPTLANILNLIQIFKETPLSFVNFATVPSSSSLLLINIAQGILLLLILFQESLILRLRGRRQGSGNIDMNEAENSRQSYPQEAMREIPGKTILEVENVTKIFDGNSARKKALDGVSFQVFEKEIFAVIGHNGSGKSTLLSIIVGLLEATSGKVNKMLSAAVSSGKSPQSPASSPYVFCPQSDILYKSLTVIEHLRFMAAIRCLPSDSINRAIETVSKELDLGVLLDRQCQVLSGGEKRRVCVAMAFLGNPALVILDEPTSGMDPENRHNLWKFLELKRTTSCMILCTHFMDEAGKNNCH